MWSSLLKIPVAKKPEVVNYEKQAAEEAPVESVDQVVAVEASLDSDSEDDFVLIESEESANVSTGADVSHTPIATPVESAAPVVPPLSISSIPTSTPSYTTPAPTSNTTATTSAPPRTWGKIAAVPAAAPSSDFPDLATGVAVAKAGRRTGKAVAGNNHFEPQPSPAMETLNKALESGVSLDRLPVDVVGSLKLPGATASREAHLGYTGSVAEGHGVYNSGHGEAAAGHVLEKFVVPVPKLELGPNTVAGADTKEITVDFSWNGHRPWTPRQGRRSKNTHPKITKQRSQARAQKSAGW